MFALAVATFAAALAIAAVGGWHAMPAARRSAHVQRVGATAYVAGLAAMCGACGGVLLLQPAAGLTAAQVAACVAVAHACSYGALALALAAAMLGAYAWRTRPGATWAMQRRNVQSPLG